MTNRAEKVANGIALALAVGGAVAVLVLLIVEWIIGPWWASVALTLVAAAVATMLVLYIVADRSR